MDKIRLQKFLAGQGVASRRKVEEMIKLGKIKINGEQAKLGDKVDPEQDEITMDGESVKPKKDDSKVYIMLNKPIGYTCTRGEFEGERNIYELLPEAYQSLNPVGRLDKDSRGLFILTNDGDYIYKTTHPKFEQEKEYEIEVGKKIIKQDIAKLLKGIDIGDGEKEVVAAKSVKSLDERKLRIVITQGKKRQIRRMFARLGHETASLKRIRIKDIELGNLKEGEFRKIFLKQ